MSDLQLLFENKIANITVDDFLSAKQISSLLTAITQQPEWNEGEIPETYEHLFVGKKKPMHLFSSQYMVIVKGLNENQYLEFCKGYQKVWQKIIAAAGFDPFLNLVNYLKNTYKSDVKVAAKNHLAYSPLVARDLYEEVLPHADYGPYDGPGWVIDQVTPNCLEYLPH